MRGTLYYCAKSMGASLLMPCKIIGWKGAYLSTQVALKKKYGFVRGELKEQHTDIAMRLR